MKTKFNFSYVNPFFYLRKLETLVLQLMANCIYWYCTNSWTNEQFERGYTMGLYLDAYAVSRDIYLK